MKVYYELNSLEEYPVFGEPARSNWESVILAGNAGSFVEALEEDYPDGIDCEEIYRILSDTYGFVFRFVKK